MYSGLFAGRDARHGVDGDGGRMADQFGGPDNFHIQPLHEEYRGGVSEGVVLQRNYQQRAAPGQDAHGVAGIRGGRKLTLRVQVIFSPDVHHAVIGEDILGHLDAPIKKML